MSVLTVSGSKKENVSASILLMPTQNVGLIPEGKVLNVLLMFFNTIHWHLLRNKRFLWLDEINIITDINVLNDINCNILLYSQVNNLVFHIWKTQINTFSIPHNIS